MTDRINPLARDELTLEEAEAELKKVEASVPYQRAVRRQTAMSATERNRMSLTAHDIGAERAALAEAARLRAVLLIRRDQQWEREERRRIRLEVERELRAARPSPWWKFWNS